jgi:uncharacterized protein (DUF983 family)
MDTNDNKRDVTLALQRGALGRCPDCGKGRLFRAYLKVADQCPACGEALHHHRADDAPAYFVILIVGHLMVPIALAIETAFSPPYWVHLVTWGPVTLGLSLLLLPVVKGAIVALQWANRMHGFDSDSVDGDPALVAEPVLERRR